MLNQNGLPNRVLNLIHPKEKEKLQTQSRTYILWMGKNV